MDPLNLVVLKKENSEVGAQAINAFDVLDFLLVERNLLKVVEHALIVLGTPSEHCLIDARHREKLIGVGAEKKKKNKEKRKRKRVLKRQCIHVYTHFNF